MVDVAGLESNGGVCCDPSLVLPHRCSSGEGTQHYIYFRFSALGGRLGSGLKPSQVEACVVTAHQGYPTDVTLVS